MTTLLAKSRTHGELTLEQHLIDTEQAALALFRPGTRWGDRWPAFFRLASDDPHFLRQLRVAALFHDIGKANEDFQKAVTATAFVAQTLRHEHLSALVMCLPEVRAWLSSGGLDVDICTGAVLSHHLKAHEEDGEYRWGQFKESPKLLLHFETDQIRAILDRIAAIVGSPAPSLPSGVLPSQFTGAWFDALKSGKSSATKLRRSLKGDDARRRRLAAVKVGLIVCDAVASGLFRVGESIDQWVDLVAHAQALDADRIRHDIIGARLKKIGGGVEAPLHPFQSKGAQVGPRGLLLAACGAGKTLAAWKWAEEQARTRDIGRVIFLYPTRGTATEGFRDYAGWAPEGEATLLHGTAEYELEKMRENPPEAVAGKTLGASEAESRLFALGLWSKRYFSATVDQFLSAMEHRYEALCLLPALADAAVIIDEVHSFDRKMFESLISFLKEFDVPVLCMTATLPTSRREQLEEVGLTVFPSRAQSAELADLAAKERAPRYRLTRVSIVDDALLIATRAYEEGRRVLWVVNQVARAQALAAELEERLSTSVLCYHSRFKLEDRRRAHEATIRAFQQTTKPTIAVTTQVCEMSLDLDAEVLLSEECPVTSLVQRFGRANRHLRVPGVLAQLVTYPAPDGQLLPYTASDLVGVDGFLKTLVERDVCQAELAEQIEALELSETRATDASSLFYSGYYAVPRDFRDLDAFAQPCILTDDIQAAAALFKHRRPFDGLVVPVPRQHASPAPSGARLAPWLRVADSKHYHPSWGFVAPRNEVA